MTTASGQELLTTARGYLPTEKSAQVEKAYHYAARCHANQLRESGEPYIEHPVSTAKFLANLNLDATTLAAALLHDVVEDCGITPEELARQFGEDVSRLVDGVTKLTRFNLTKWEGSLSNSDEDQLKSETLRKMLVAMAEDVRVILIKLADRLHNMDTIEALPTNKQRAIAQETLDIYAPLAHRLGIWDIKWRLEDMAFRCLDPTTYHKISDMLVSKRDDRESYITSVKEVLDRELIKSGLTAEIIGRPKHIYSIHHKSSRYAELGKKISDIYDLYAIRILVENQADCYNALGIVHNLWRPIPGQFDDYIANPKDNLYQSLHTTVFCKDATPLEVQIRTFEMHRVDEYGVAAHWRYKERDGSDNRFEQKMTWLRQLLDWQRNLTATDEFLESVKTDLFKDCLLYTSDAADE